MELYKYSKNVREKKLKTLVDKVFKKSNQSTESCLKLLYKQLIDICFNDCSRINELKDFMYSFTVSQFLYTQAIDKSEEIFADIKEIKCAKISQKESENILSQGILNAMYKQNDLKGFKAFLKTFFVVATNAGTPMESTWGLIKNYFQCFILNVLQKASSLKEVAEILGDLRELKDLEIFGEADSDSIVLGIESQVLGLSSGEIQESQKIDLMNIKSAVVLLFPGIADCHVLLKIQRLLAVSQLVKMNTFQFGKNLQSELVPGPVVETVSNAKVTQILQKYYTPPQYKFKQFLVKVYSVPEEAYFTGKIQREIEALNSFKGTKGFVKILNSTETCPFTLALSACDRISKHDLTLEHCHQLISTYLYLYCKKLKAKLPDFEYFYINKKNQVVLSDFSFFSFPGSNLLTSQLDLHGNVCELPLVDFSFMQKCASIILALSEKLDEPSRLEISHRLFDFLFDKNFH